MIAFPRERFAAEITLTPASVAAFAEAAGDRNPVHHDPAFAANTLRFRRPIYADETIRLEWLVTKVSPNQKLNGDIVELRGRIKGEDGQTAIGAKGKLLVTDQLQLSTT